MDSEGSPRACAFPACPSGRTHRRLLAALIAGIFSSQLILVPPARPIERADGPRSHSTPSGLYRNDALGYVVSYSDRWRPSGNSYANAFELRNYDTSSPDSTPPDDRASIIIVDTVGGDPESVLRLLDDLRADPSARVEPVSAGGRRGIRLTRIVEASQLGRGASRGVSDSNTSAESIHAIDVYIANGKHLISIEARVSVGADPAVLEDIAKIQKSVGFYKSRPR